MQLESVSKFPYLWTPSFEYINFIVDVGLECSWSIKAPLWIFKILGSEIDYFCEIPYK